MSIEFTDVMALLQTLIGTAGTSKVGFDPASVLQAYSEGQIQYDPISGGHVLDTKYPDVRLNTGRELHIPVYNNTALTVLNGKPMSVDGTFTGNIPNVDYTDTTSKLSVLGFAGVTTMDIPPFSEGVVTPFGCVNDVPTGSLSLGFIYAGSVAGTYTQVRPKYPIERLIIGGINKTGVSDGVIEVNPKLLNRRNASRSYHFSSADEPAGLSYEAGFYDWASSSVTLSQASLTVTHGAANLARAAHPAILVEAAGVVDTGQVGMRVTGTLDSESGVQVAAQTVTLTTDITLLDPLEVEEVLSKFSGTITFELYVVSGSPVNYSVTFNYGYSAYEDFLNRDVTIVGLECLFTGGANDSTSNITLRYHSPLNWTYASTGFIPGDGVICERLVDQAVNPNIQTGVQGKYKRSNLSQFIKGSEKEGAIIEIDAASNNSFRRLSIHLSGFDEEL